MVGPVAAAVSAGELETPAVLQTHGGRARAIEAGDLHIDVGFVAAPTADVYSNINGIQGGAACGVLAYAAADIAHADRVVAVMDNLVPYLACPITYSQDYVDFLVAVDSIGDPSKIVSGTTRPTTDPLGLRIADTAARVIDASGPVARRVFVPDRRWRHLPCRREQPTRADDLVRAEPGGFSVWPGTQ